MPTIRVVVKMYIRSKEVFSFLSPFIADVVHVFGNCSPLYVKCVRSLVGVRILMILSDKQEHFN